MERRTVLSNLAVLTGLGSVSTVFPESNMDNESISDNSMKQEGFVRITVSNSLGSDAQTSLTLRSGDDEFLSADFTSTPDEPQDLGIPAPTNREFQLHVSIDATLDGPDEVTLGRETVQASGSSLSTEDSHRFTHRETTELDVSIGDEPLLDIEQVD
ncbi:hypothetical protein [Haloarchaeobius baliensis]|uniref:hypothetical protein n=1 Tax=Haloarchaeobius baliensis TaxID=1670458 RepID=UPI003F880A63